MIPANIIKTINGEPCVMGEVIIEPNGKYILYKTGYVPPHEINHGMDLKEGDKVWVKCYRKPKEQVKTHLAAGGLWTERPYEIYLDEQGNAIIYPVEQEPEGRKIAVNIANGVGILRPEPEVSQEEIWSEVFDRFAFDINFLTDNYTITRKTTPQ